MPEHICLIVDDVGAIRGYLALILKERGFQSLEAATATEALKIVQKLSGGLDLIVTDIKLPGDMNGVDLAHSIRYAFPVIPIIVISGYANVGSLETAGFQFIPKPFMRKTILDAVDRAMSGEQSWVAKPRSLSNHQRLQS